MLLLVLLTACKGVGMGNMSSKGFFEPSEEEKAEESFWDRLYGRKSLARESSDWKDFYKAPNQDATKPDYCGFWGNCSKEDVAAPANCNFYGNCSGQQTKQGWW